MTRLTVLGWVAVVGCTAGSANVEPVQVDFKDVVGEWVLAPAPEAQTQVGLTFGEHTLDFGPVPGACEPTPDLPFTEVQGQKSLAALKCNSPDGGMHHVVVVEVLGADPAWPAPIALGMVMSRQKADNQVSLVTMGGVDMPLGVIPKAPKVEVVAPVPPPEAPPE